MLTRSIACCALLVLGVLGACDDTARTTCHRDSDCPDGRICMADDQCLPADVARRTGTPVGDECTVVDGHDVGCAPGEICLRQFCSGGVGEDTGLGDSGMSDAEPAADAPPTFNGLKSATLGDDGTSAELCWTAGSDDTTAPEELFYDLYQATSSGAQTFDAANVTSPRGATCTTVTSLAPGSMYCWVARARDRAGNRDSNTVEICLTTPTVDCAEYELNIQPIFDAECVHCHSGDTPPAGLDLTNFEGVIAGGVTGHEVIKCQPEQSLIIRKISMDQPPVGVRMPADGPPYLDEAQIDLISGWIRDGARASCAEANPCADEAPPTFAGLETAVAQPDGASAHLCWSAGSDETSPPEALVYDVFQSEGAGGEDYQALPNATSAAGATCVDVAGLRPGVEFCWVVRARDEAGNRDENTVEHCIVTAAADCLDYETVIQPIFNSRCIACHAGASPPANLNLESYEGVLRGGMTGNEVNSCQPEMSLIIHKLAEDNPPVGSRMPLGGPYLDQATIDLVRRWIEEGARHTCDELTPCEDGASPLFDGLDSATLGDDGASAQLCWNPASDDITPSDQLRYDIYRADTPGGEDFVGLPGQTSDMGQTCARVEGLTPGQTYCFVVRARDAAGNQDENVVEHCLEVPAAVCIDYEAMIQPIFNQRCIGCHSGPNPPQNLNLESFEGVIAGGRTGNEVTACQPDQSLLIAKVTLDRPPVGARMPLGGPHLDQPTIDLLRGWISDGARHTCADANPCADGAAPQFQGLERATPTVAPGGVELCWSPGHDETTSDGNLVYDAYQASAPGGEDFVALPSATSDAGATCITVSGLQPAQQYCWVVRARDGAGNRDANAVEHCVEMPAVDCVDYDAFIQPIFDGRCVGCHAGAAPPAGLSLDSYEGVIAGGNTGHEVTACQPAQSLIIAKLSMDQPPVGARMPFGGPYLDDATVDLVRRWIADGALRHCGEASPCGDATPPQFQGLTSATLNGDNSGAQLCWATGHDNLTPDAELVYDIFQGDGPGQEAFAGLPAATSGPGVNCVTVGGLQPGRPYCWVALARDAAGNRDANRVERCLDVPGVACIDYASMIQPIFNNRCLGCHTGAAPPAGLRLDGYEGVLAGGVTGGEVTACQPDQSLIIAKLSQDRPPVGARMPFGGPYLDQATIDLVSRWISEGARATCDEPDPCSDAAPPFFVGLQSATLQPDNSSAELCWVSGHDDLTPDATLLYDVFQADSPGAEAFDLRPTATSAPGVTCTLVGGLQPARSYCWVVRSRDGAGNRDANVVEHCLDVPAADCIDYASMVQPIFNSRCIGCHSGAAPPAGLQLDDYARVRAGGVTGNEVTACQPDQSLIIAKLTMDQPPVGARMPFGGPYLDAATVELVRRWIAEGARAACGDPNPCLDASPPQFAGLATATLAPDNASARLCWQPGADDLTAEGSLIYDLYQAGAPGGEALAGLPTESSQPGANCATMSGLMPAQQYCWIVRARDGAGNRDANVIERCVQTPAAACIDYESMIRPILDTRCTGCHSGANPPASLNLTSYDGLMRGGITGNEVVRCQPDSSLVVLKTTLAQPPVGQRMPLGGPYLDVATTDLIKRWIGEGARHACAEPDPCGDAVPPVFAGLATAVINQGGASGHLCWQAGRDDTTAAASLLYDVYQAGAPGAENYAGLPSTTSAAGQTCLDMPGLLPDTQYCWVVRARDGAGNRDANVVEHCARTPALACVDYATMVQPIFNSRCIACHSGAAPPANLNLTTIDGVLRGGNTGNEVIRCQGDQSLIVAKITRDQPPVGARMPLGGPYLDAPTSALIQRWIDEGARANCAAPDPCQDAVAPQFAGVTTAVLNPDGASAHVCWAAGSDDTTPANQLLYDLYQAGAPGAENFAAMPSTTSGPGQTCVDVGGLMPSNQFCWVVRARDGAGNRDANVVERCVQTLAPACIDYAALIQPIFDRRCIGCHTGANPPANLSLVNYDGVIRGGTTGNEVVRCQPDQSLLVAKISMDQPPVGARMPFGGPYLDAPTIDLVRQWIAEGGRSSCAQPDPCLDNTAPNFAGLNTAVLNPDGTSAHLCWAAGSDDTAPAASLVYDLYQANAPGGQAFAGLPSMTSGPGQTCVDVAGLMPASQYCWVARARDGAGNRDANVVERCVQTQAADCIDYTTMIQPIFDRRCAGCHSGPNPPQNLNLTSYEGVTRGGNTGNEVNACQPGTSLLILKIGLAQPPVGAQMPFGGPYLDQGTIDLISQWIGEGARRGCNEPDPCSDANPPDFGGIVRVTPQPDGVSAQICWAAAADDLTPPDQIVYDVYQATQHAGQNFDGLPTVSSAPGELCVTANVLSPGDEYCWVALAKDAAGNRGGDHAVEVCARMPALPAGCLDYETYIQPLLDRNCVRCHAGERAPQWLRLDSYEELMAGSVRRNEVIACDPDRSLIVSKIGPTPSIGKRMPFDGPPYLTDNQTAMVRQWIARGAQRTCDQAAGCDDVTAPQFGGVRSAVATDAQTIRVCWDAARDANVPAADMRYEVYEATQAGGERFGEPAQEAVVGETCIDIATAPDTNLCFVVRAVDRRGNRDQNRVEACARTPAAACEIEYDRDVQPILSARCVYCHTGASARRFLDLGSYGGVLAGGAIRNEVRACDWASSLINQKTSGGACGRRMPFDGPPWLAPSERSILERWVGAGARRTCDEATPCGDRVAPQFAGLERLAMIDAVTLEICWRPATDNVSPPESISYDVYEARAPGGESFGAPASYVGLAGTTCVEIPVAPGFRNCFVVRARDLAGNRDANRVEGCMDPPATCVDYNLDVQTIFTARCVHCHSGRGAPDGIKWSTYAEAVQNDEVRPCRADDSKVVRVVEECEMPYDTREGACRACLTPSQQQFIEAWIDQGAALTCPNGGCQ